MRAFSTCLSVTCLAAASLAAAPTVSADIPYKGAVTNGSICQLSIPTTNTGVRPKATGFRNESKTISSFVICPVLIPSDTIAGVTQLSVALYSFDGNTRDVSCTAVVNVFGTEGKPQVYSAKVEPVSSASEYDMLRWNSEDFGGIPGDTFDAMSVTCLLPPQTAINYIQVEYAHAVGS